MPGDVIDLAAYRPRRDLILVQIFALHREGYVDLEEAKFLMQKYVASGYNFELWRKLHLNPHACKRSSLVRRREVRAS